MAREEYFHDPGAPAAEVVAPSVFAAIRDALGRLLLVRRVDNGNWELPGGQVDIGETPASALQREVAEEAGVTIEVLGVSGVYSDPGHVIRSVAGQVRQPFTVCFRATTAAGSRAPRPDHNETSQVAWIAPAALASLRMHRTMRHWIDDALAFQTDTYVGRGSDGTAARPAHAPRRVSPNSIGGRRRSRTG